MKKGNITELDLRNLKEPMIVLYHNPPFCSKKTIFAKLFDGLSETDQYILYDTIEEAKEDIKQIMTPMPRHPGTPEYIIETYMCDAIRVSANCAFAYIGTENAMLDYLALLEKYEAEGKITDFTMSSGSGKCNIGIYLDGLDKYNSLKPEIIENLDELTNTHGQARGVV